MLWLDKQPGRWWNPRIVIMLLAPMLGTLLAVGPPQQVWRLHLGLEALAGGEFCNGVTGDCDHWNKDANRVAAVLRSDVAGFVGEPFRPGMAFYVRPGIQWLAGPWHSPTVSILEPFLECVAAFGENQFFFGIGGVLSSHGSRGAMVWFGLGGATAVGARWGLGGDLGFEIGGFGGHMADAVRFSGGPELRL